MALLGYTKKTERKNGGIRVLGLIERTSISGMTFNYGKGLVSSITFSGTERFKKYEFREDEAEYKEVVTLQNGSVVVVHELKFLLDKVSNNATLTVDQLINNDAGGLVAVVVTANDEVFIVGYSPEFRDERPLKVVSVNGTTGRTLKDGTGEMVTLRCEDVAKAKNYIGIADSLF